jgi:pimeloyl-ACP methyl ester carboxylesterase
MMGIIMERDSASDDHQAAPAQCVPAQAVLAQAASAQCALAQSVTAQAALAQAATAQSVPAQSVTGQAALAQAATGRSVPAQAVPVPPAAVLPAPVPPAPVPAVPGPTVPGTAGENRPVVLWRRSALPTKRCVLYLHGDPEALVPEDLVTWYTERGFHVYAADPRGPGRRPRRPDRGTRFAGLDAACRHLRETEGIDMIIVAAHSADALTAALWCDAGRDQGLADALVLSSPAFQRMRRGLDIACPVLVLSPAGGPEAKGGPVGRMTGRRRRKDAATVRLGLHVTWLRLEDGPAEAAPGAGGDRRRFFDELGRWLGAYMYGQVRDQLL